MDSKAGAIDGPPTRISRWLTATRSTLSRVLTRRPPFEDGFQLTSIFVRNMEKRDASVREPLGQLTKVS